MTQFVAVCKALMFPVSEMGRIISESEEEAKMKALAEIAEMEGSEVQEVMEQMNQIGGADSSNSQFIANLIQLVIFVSAIYLAWTCNSQEQMWARVLITLFAALFSGVYLLWYLIVHVLLKVECVRPTWDQLKERFQK